MKLHGKKKNKTSEKYRSMTNHFYDGLKIHTWKNFTFSATIGKIWKEIYIINIIWRTKQWSFYNSIFDQNEWFYIEQPIHYNNKSIGNTCHWGSHLNFWVYTLSKTLNIRNNFQQSTPTRICYEYPKSCFIYLFF